MSRIANVIIVLGGYLIYNNLKKLTQLFEIKVYLCNLIICVSQNERYCNTIK